jgi:GNAT superfamily N-acetyltransferase
MPESTEAVQNSPPSLRVRRALPADADALAQLRYAFRLERRPATESDEAFTRRCSNWMRPRLRGDSRWTAWVAERERRLIGQVWLQIVEKLPNPGPESELHAYLSNFFVLPRERNSGAGTQLLRAAVAHCRSSGVDTVFLWPTERSVALYRRTGFGPPSDLLVLELREPKHR